MQDKFKSSASGHKWDLDGPGILGLMPAKDGAEEPVGVPEDGATRGCISSPDPVCSGTSVLTDLFVVFSFLLFLDLHTTQIATTKATITKPPITQNVGGTGLPILSSMAMVSPALHRTVPADALLVAGIALKQVYPSSEATHLIGTFQTSKAKHE